MLNTEQCETNESVEQHIVLSHRARQYACDIVEYIDKKQNSRKMGFL